MTPVALIALVLIAEVALAVPAAVYVAWVYAGARSRSPREDVPPLYTMVALLCSVVAVGGMAMLALILYYFANGDFPAGGISVGMVVGVQLLAPIIVAEFIRRIRRSPGPPPADPPATTKGPAPVPTPTRLPARATRPRPRPKPKEPAP